MPTEVRPHGYIFPYSNHNSNSDGYNNSTFGSTSLVRTDLGRITISNPNWRETIARRGDATSPYSVWSQKVRTESTSSSWSYDYGPPTYGSTGSGRVVFTGYPSMFGQGDFVGPSQPALSPSVYNKLVVTFLNRIQGASRIYSGGQDVGELRETLQGIRKPAKGLWDGMFSYLDAVDKRCRGLTKLRIVTRVIRDTYLEYAFQWRPLVNSINESGAAMNQRLDLLDQEVFETSASTQELFKSSGPIGSILDPENWFKWNRSQTDVYVLKTRMYAIVKRDLDRDNRFAENLGLTPHNWVATAWQLLPLSFVADYFVNVGACLSAGGSLNYLFVTAGQSSHLLGYTQIKSTGDLSYSASLSSPGFTVSSISIPTHEAVLDYKGFWRIPINPNTLWIIPVVQIPSMPSQWINLAALSTAITNVSRNLLGRIRG